MIGVLGEGHHDDVGGGQHQTTVNVATWSKLILVEKLESFYFVLSNYFVLFSLIFQHFFIPLHEKEEKYFCISSG